MRGVSTSPKPGVKREQAASIWTCKACGWEYRSPLAGVLAVSHLCPKRDRQRRQLKRVSGR